MAIHSCPPRRPRAAAFAPTLATAAILSLSFLLLLDGYRTGRALQLTILMAPGVLLLLVPVRASLLHRGRMVLVTLWLLLFLADGAVRAFLLDAYDAAPDSTFVIGAVANTGVRESREYAATLAPVLGGRVALLVACVVVLAALSRFGRRDGKPGRPMLVLVMLLVAVSAVGHAVKPWRKLHPLVFWNDWRHAIAGAQDRWQRYGEVRAETLARADDMGVRLAAPGPSTVVLVIGESVNRDNMSLYGYVRATTPELDRMQRDEGESMLVFRDAWSVEASTLPSLHRLFELDKDDHGGEDPHLLALARSAGYRVWWISNHDDVGIEQEHARLAQETVFVNRSPGRSGGGLDGRLLPHVEAALADPAPRKLIVVHLLGAHPHYQQRYPAGAHSFAAGDAVDVALTAAGRSWRIGMLRKEYDAAIRYHDSVVARTLALLRVHDSERAGDSAWIYLSDHGQEVGHERDFAGHSRTTSAGYRIPAIVWRDRPWSQAARLERHAFRADWTSWALADLLGLEWDGKDARYSVLDGGYRWRAPRLPAGVVAAVTPAPASSGGIAPPR